MDFPGERKKKALIFVTLKCLLRERIVKGIRNLKISIYFMIRKKIAFCTFLTVVQNIAPAGYSQPCKQRAVVCSEVYSLSRCEF